MASCRPRAGEYDEEWLDALDFAVAAAGERGLKPRPLADQLWDAYGGMESYVMWANDANEMAGLSVSEFYTSEATRESCSVSKTFASSREGPTSTRT